jgi:hypothetical protein
MIQQQMCDVALNGAGKSAAQRKQRASTAKPQQIFTASFLDQKIKEQQVTVEVGC